VRAVAGQVGNIKGPRCAAGWAALVLGLATLVPGAARAALDCSVSATGVAFGVYDPTIATPDDSTGTITVTCVYTGPGGADQTNYTVTLSTGASGTYAQRQMTAGSSRLGYNLFGDAGRSQVWGNASAGTTIATGSVKVGPGVGNSTRTATHTVYGRVPALQDADTGNYTDSILVTLTF
jgi:spore coat protein U-like protein